MKSGERTGIAAVAGRRIDAEGAGARRFPSAAVELVKGDIRRLIVEHRIGTLVASAACGADIVALEAAALLGLRLVIVLPFDAERFRATSVVDRGGEWGKRFDDLLSVAGSELIVLSPPAGSDDAAYEQATRRIIAEAVRRAPADESPLAIAVWEGQARPGVDATRSFIEQAEAAGMKAQIVISQPEEAARRYLAGKSREFEHALEARAALVRSHPVLANQLAREVARRLLLADLNASAETINQAWKACKQVEAFGFARRILGRRIEQLEAAAHSVPSDLTKLRQQQAMCTSKDPDLSASIRHDWALSILRAEDPALKGDSEHQGVAGGIWKRRWEWDGSRVSLEKALRHYRAGVPPQPEDPLAPAVFSESGYVEVNCAFVLELLGCLSQDSTTSERFRKEAEEIRQRLTALLPKSKKDLWTHATLAETYLGLRDLDKTVEHLKRYLDCSPDPWELETTLRQLVRLAHLRDIPDADLRKLLAEGLSQSSDSAALTSLLVGKVGLALSGGGFRASLFHLGVLARLAEQDVLRHVEVLSCVSGGSIVGALYYQRLKRELEGERELEPADYVRIVEQVIADFLSGMSRNVRTRLLTNFRTTLAIINGDDRRYARAVATAFHRELYARVDPNSAYMDELTVQPPSGPEPFHPARHNWTRRNKVPSLVLNAATLNTGHSWQFTARSMGESPFTIQAAVDSNVRLRRTNYAPTRRVRMAEAVAASACVPGLFAPLQLDDLYDGFSVRLVDGGVFDNQGASSLTEQDCQVLLVSDAAGQLFAESTSRGGHVPPLQRSIGVFQERIRQTGYDALVRRQQAGQVRSLVYTHLTQGLGVPAKDWVACDDPVRENDQLPSSVDAQSSTGVDRELQVCLAKMRTDLDLFSEIECAALMASGYLSLEKPLAPLLTRLREVEARAGVEPRAPHSFWFSKLLPLMQPSSPKNAAYELLRDRLDAGAMGVGRLLKQDEELRHLALGVSAALVAALAVLVYVFRDAPLWTVGGLGLLALIATLRQLAGRFGKQLANLIDVVTEPGGTVKSPLFRYAGAALLTGVAILAVNYLDPKYLELGKLKALDNVREQ